MTSKPKTPQQHVTWCMKQKRGIKLEEPNNNLCNVYLKKAKSALNMLNAAIEKEEIDWIATTAYYARYFAFYAILQKCGITSEIHDCTLSLFHTLLVEEKLIEERLYTEFEAAKELRVNAQYYVTEELDKEQLKNDAKTASNFVLNMEELNEKITEKHITTLRTRLQPK